MKRVLLLLLSIVSPVAGLAQPNQAVHATRFAQNPLITVNTSASLGGNVNGPTVIRVPDWIDRPLGRYYMVLREPHGRLYPSGVCRCSHGPLEGL